MSCDGMSGIIGKLPKRCSMQTILLVEDNELNRDMLSRRLARKGYEVIMAANGREGVALAHAYQPDLILMDLSLPIMDGWEALRTLKTSSDTSSIPVIALTAHAFLSDRQSALESGFDDYESKPVDMQRLLLKIDSFLMKETAP
jgi:two-component system cell cycle response regulator DivK